MTLVPLNPVGTLSWEAAVSHIAKSIQEGILQGEAPEEGLRKLECLLQRAIEESTTMEATSRRRFLEGLLKSIREVEIAAKIWLREALPQLDDLARIQLMKKAYDSSRYIDWLIWPEMSR